MKKVSKPSKNTQDQSKKPPAPQKEVRKSGEEEPDDNRMDFGGLPNRDLKKNLGGCG